MRFWDILHIKPTTDVAAIKKAYAKQALLCHPEDKPKEFQALYEAYHEALRYAEQRRSVNPQKAKEPETPAFRAVPNELRALAPRRGKDIPERSAAAMPQEPESATGQPSRYTFPSSGNRHSVQDSSGTEASGHAKPLHFPLKGKKPSLPPERTFPAGGPEPHTEETPEHAPLFRFPKNSPPPYGEPDPQPDSSAETPQEQPETIRFPKGERFAVQPQARETAPPAPPRERGTPYRFPSPIFAPSPAHNTGRETSPLSAAYIFPSTAASPAPVSPPKHPGGKPAGGTEHLVFPNLLPLKSDCEIEAPPAPPVRQGTATPFPQTRERAERVRLAENAHAGCLRTLEASAGQEDAEQLWYTYLHSGSFLAAQYEGVFLRHLLELLQNSLSPAMASAFYMAYGFAAKESLRLQPEAKPLYDILNAYLRLPQNDFPRMTLAEILHKSDAAISGLARLCKICNAPYLCGQAVRTPIFAQVQFQPYFLRRLTGYFMRTSVAESWRQTMADVYRFHEQPASPCLAPLAECLPTMDRTKEWAVYVPQADGLLTDDAALAAVCTAARTYTLDLMLKTKKGFPQSSRRVPWDFVFTRQEFTLVRLDPLFLAHLLDFLEIAPLPVGIWPALAEAYASSRDTPALLPENYSGHDVAEQLARLRTRVGRQMNG